MRRRWVPAPVRAAIRGWLEERIRVGLAQGIDELGARLQSLYQDLAAIRRELDQRHAEARAEVAALRSELARRHTEVMGTAAGIREIVAADFDGIRELRAQLLRARQCDTYRNAFDAPQPLVSVRIATYNRSKLLLERVIPSVLRQTYRNFEVVVVGDGCSDDTAQRLSDLRDSRITFTNLPYRGIYPDEPRRRWMVAGAAAMNEAAQLTRGEWIAPLDDDDEFAPDHIEQLLETARAGRFEMVYGNLQVQPRAPEQSHELRRYPPAYGHFGFQGAMYMSELRFFEYDLKSWVIDEASDWTLCRRMIETGVRIGWVDRPVTILYPGSPRCEPVATNGGV